MRKSCIILLFLSILTSLMSANQRNVEPNSLERHDRCGATIGLKNPDKGKVVYFIFTADSLFEGGEYALDVLRDKKVKASFFLTGNFLRDSLRNSSIIQKIIADGHYLGPHSDRHILLADWDESRTTLVTADSALTDIKNNYKELSRYGVDTVTNRYIVPPYEWYNKTHIAAYRAAGYIPVNPSPGLLTYRDYTTPDMEDYYSSDTIWHNFITNLHHKDLDGSIIILHLGTQDIRTDKFYHRLPAMIDSLRSRGYNPQSF